MVSRAVEDICLAQPNGAVAMLEKHRSRGVGEKIWQHTLNVFEKVCGKEDGSY